MLSRRDLITVGVVGSVGPAAASATPSSAPAAAEQQAADRDGQREISRRIAEVHEVLRTEFQTATLSYGVVARLRSDMEQFVRAHTKFPDYIEIGVGVFIDVYDWHVKNGQELRVSRMGDGRYHMLFMFTTLILRSEQDRNYVGAPFDRA